MNKIIICLITILSFSLNSCGQSTKKTSDKTNNKTIEKINKMNTDQLTNPIVKAAFQAWQNGDSKLFLSFFTTDAKLFDDGNARDFQKFVKEACGHEKFTTIDKVENKGLDITGNFHTESWGDFKTYFKFHPDADGKFNRLDIGQAK